MASITCFGKTPSRRSVWKKKRAAVSNVKQTMISVASDGNRSRTVFEVVEVLSSSAGMTVTKGKVHF
jgi:hypothetical protein